jgi:NADPH:quinone reductase-like Zn-dependent oxidoreductase
MSLPRVSRQWLVQKLSQNFRESVALQEVPLAEPTGREMIIKNHAVGINASDVNFTSGAYMPGVKPPFPCGFEAVGTVVAAGPKAMAKEGDTVCYMEYGAFADYQTTSKVFPVPSADPKYIPLLVSGLTAAISLNENGVDVFKKDAGKKPPRVGLVTAAAGGTGQFATQLLAHAGAKKVIATCSSQEKADFLKSIGATDVINLSEEKLGIALPELAPSGVNVAYESVGGKVLDSVVDNLATAGKCVQIGFISSYLEKGGMARGVSPQASVIPVKLLTKSASMNGFFLMHYPHLMSDAYQNLVQLLDSGAISSKVDFGPNLQGIEAIPDGVDYLFSKKSIGKICVKLD